MSRAYKRKKGLLVIVDGLGDRPIPALDLRTPLEAASTPNLDRLVAESLCGQVDPLSPGLPVGTQIGVGILLGLLPKDVSHLARGPVEAAGAGVPLLPGDVAIRCNFATLRRVDGGFEVLDRRAGRIREQTTELAASLADVELGDGITATLFPATHHRAVLSLHGPGLSASISDTDPGSMLGDPRVLTCFPRPGHESGGARTAEALNHFIDLAHQRLEEHPVNRARVERSELPANGLITREAGMVRSFKSVITRLGLRAAVVAAESTVLGLGKLFNYTTVNDPCFTAMPDTDLEAKVEAAAEALDAHDIVFLHVKAPDIFAHDMDPAGKRDMIERIDAALEPLLFGDTIVGVTADHSTESLTGRHCGDPVPSVLYMPGGRRDTCAAFGETACMNGGLGRLTANAYLLCMLDAMGSMSDMRPPERKLFLP